MDTNEPKNPDVNLSQNTPQNIPPGITSESSSQTPGPQAPPPLSQENNLQSGKPEGTGLPIFALILLLIVFFLGSLLFAGWYYQLQFNKANSSSQVQNTTGKSNTIIIGTDATFPPMEYKDANGQLIGYDIDLGNKIADELDVKATYKNIPWKDLFKALDDKKIDMIISAVTITDERKKHYDFSIPYLDDEHVIVVKKQTTNISSTKDLKGKKVAVLQATDNEIAAQKYTSKNLVIDFADTNQVVQAVIDGKADALLMDLTASKNIVENNPNLTIAGDPFSDDSYGIVFRKGYPHINSVNQAISDLRMKGNEGELQQRWLE